MLQFVPWLVLHSVLHSGRWNRHEHIWGEAVGERVDVSWTRGLEYGRVGRWQRGEVTRAMD